MSESSSPAFRWGTATLIAAAVAVLGFLLIRPSEEARLTEAVNDVPLAAGTMTGTYDHMLPADLETPCTGFESEGDFAPAIAGDETTMRACLGGRDLLVMELSYQGVVWGYMLSTDDNVVVIVDTDADGVHDLLYARHQPVYMPDWVAQRADG